MISGTKWWHRLAFSIFILVYVLSGIGILPCATALFSGHNDEDIVISSLIFSTAPFLLWGLYQWIFWLTSGRKAPSLCSKSKAFLWTTVLIANLWITFLVGLFIPGGDISSDVYGVRVLGMALFPFVVASALAFALGRGSVLIFEIVYFIVVSLIYFFIFSAA